MDWIIEKHVSGTTIRAEITRLGNDYHILLTGGGQPHIGCIVLALPRPSLTGNGQVSSTASVLNVTGHKDEQICRYLAEQISARKKAVVVCSGGVHMDGITEKQIEEIVEIVREIAEEIAKKTK
ncbi:MAG: hypothetical protein ACI4S0_02950 [Dorea sp.]